VATVHRIYSVWFAPSATNPFHLTPAADARRIDKVLDAFGDWIRVSHSQWFLWTDRTKEEVFNALNPLRKDENDQCIVVAVQPEAAVGWAPKWIWTWLNDKMTRQFHGKP
jgi:hypothetical protein